MISAGRTILVELIFRGIRAIVWDEQLSHPPIATACIFDDARRSLGFPWFVNGILCCDRCYLHPE